MHNMAVNVSSFIDRLEKVSTGVESHFSGISYEIFNLKPDPQKWSIAEQIAHLIKVNSSYFPILEKMISGKHDTPLIGRIGFLNRKLGKVILDSVNPKGGKKYKTMSIWQPDQSQYSLDVLSEFKEMQSDTIKWIERTDELLMKSKTITSPANKNIAYPILTAWDIIVSHEERHLGQAIELLQLLQKQL